MPKLKTIEQLRRELEQKETLLNKLQAQRGAVVRQLAGIDRTIAQLLGTTASVEVVAPRGRGGRRGRPPGRPAKVVAKPAAKADGRKLRRGSLPAYIVQVLEQAGKPMRAVEIQKAVLKAGYKTDSKDFYGIVATALRNPRRFQNVSRGLYRLT
jgi:hypothetical protein